MVLSRILAATNMATEKSATQLKIENLINEIKLRLWMRKNILNNKTLHRLFENNTFLKYAVFNRVG